MNAIRYLNFLAMLEAQDPTSPAFLYPGENGPLSLSYGHLIEKIRAYPIVNKTSIGVLCDGALDTIIAIFAYVAAKKQIVMLNPMDKPDLLAKQIAIGEVDYLVGNKPLAQSLSSCLTKGLDHPNSDLLFFTSGTTNSNKAVVLTEQNFCNSAYNGGACLPLTKEDTLLCLLPLSHVFGFVCSLLWGLSFGAKIALGRGMRHFFDDGIYYHATAVSLVPQIASFMATNKIWNPEMRLVLIGAGSCPLPILQTIQSQGIRVSYGYGLTETSSGVALSTGEDPEAMRVCPDNEITIAPDGEILLKAPTCIMKGYYKNPEATNEVLKDGIFHTGDLGKFDENGLLHIVGRKKDILVLSDGTKIFCPEYEQELLPYLKGLDYAISLKEDKVCLFVGNAEEGFSVQEAINAFNLNKPRGQRISKIVYQKEPLPRTQTAKIKRWALGK